MNPTLPHTTDSHANSNHPASSNAFFEEMRTKLEQGGVKQSAETVSQSIAQMIESRAAFTEDARQSFSSLMLLFSAGAALLLGPYTFQANPPKHVVLACHLLAGLMFVAALVGAGVPGVAGLKRLNRYIGLFRRVFDGGYKLYVASVFHAYALVRACGMPGTHQWFATAQKCLDATGRFFDDQGKEVTDPARDGNFYDDYTFEKSNAGRHAKNLGELIAIWESAGSTNLSRSYHRIYSVAGCAAAVMVVVCVTFAWFGVAAPPPLATCACTTTGTDTSQPIGGNAAATNTPLLGVDAKSADVPANATVPSNP